MAEFEVEFVAQSLWVEDGTWQAFQDDWKKQCAEAGEPFEDYAPDITEILRQNAAGEVAQTALTKSSVCGISDDSGRFWAVAMLNWVKQLPGTNAPTVRVRHLIVCPRLDFGLDEVEKYVQVLVGAVGGIISVAEQHFEVKHLRFHLRSPADINFFAVLGAAMARSPKFEGVETRGAWLYITLCEGDGEGETQPEG
jgi:hypothetical protein